MGTETLPCRNAMATIPRYRRISRINHKQDATSFYHEPKWLDHKGFRFRYLASQNSNPNTPPAFFVSGAFQNMQSWNKFATYFMNSGVPVILAELPGTGDADLLPLDYGLDYLADALKLILDDLGCPRVSLISASYGTPIAYFFSHRHPSRVENLVLAGTMKEIPRHLRFGVEHTIKTLRNGHMVDFANEIIGHIGPQKGNGLICTDKDKIINKRQLAQRILFNQLVNMSIADRAKYEMNTLRLIHQRTLDLSKSPECKTLVFTGEHDTFTRPEYCRRIANSIKDCTFTTIRHADHLFHMEQFATTAELLFCFTQELPMHAIQDINELETLGLSTNQTKLICA